MRHAVLLLALLPACGGGRGATALRGPAPADGHQQIVREAHDRVLDAQHALEAPSAYRFATPVPDRVASWHWQPQPDGQPHAFGWRHGWRVDFHVTPRRAGYPPQPEVLRMAFFGDGALRGIFAPGGGSAPVELDRWSPVWIDPTWRDPAAAAPR